MSTTTATTPATDRATKVVTGGRSRVSQRSLLLLDLAAGLGMLLVVADRDGRSTLRLSTPHDAIQLSPVALPAGPTVLILGLTLVTIAVAAHLVDVKARVPGWLPGVAGFLFVVDFLVWAAAGKTLPVTGLLVGALALSTPLIFGALGGVVGERVGVINVAIEAQLLFGAFSAALIASVTGQRWLALLGAAAAGALVALVLAVFAIRYVVNQIIVGVVLNVLVIGLTNFLYSTLLTSNAERFNSPVRFPAIAVPGLSEIPVLGPVLFRQTVVVYLMYAAVVAVWVMLFKTRWGLRSRAVGEHPRAADTVGIRVNRMRVHNLAIAGCIAGLGGAYLTLDSVGAFNKEMTNGAGFIALAAVIFGRWHPFRAAVAALFFGFATSLQNVLVIIGSPVPSEFMLMLPYVLTICAVAGLVGKSRPPAAAGKPYVK